SGSSSGGGSSYSSGDPWVLFFLAHPLFSVAMLAVAFVIWRAYRTSFGATTSTQRAFEAADAREPSPPSAREVSSWVDSLRASDPEFDLVAFLDQVKALFLRVQAAWAAGELAPVRRDLSDATFQRFRVQLELLRSQGVRNYTADMAVLDLPPGGLERTAAFDTPPRTSPAPTPRRPGCGASGRAPVVVPSGSAAEPRGAPPRAPREPVGGGAFFARRPGAPPGTPGSPGAGPSPPCGAALEGRAGGTCVYCAAIVH